MTELLIEVTRDRRTSSVTGGEFTWVVESGVCDCVQLRSLCALSALAPFPAPFPPPFLPPFPPPLLRALSALSPPVGGCALRRSQLLAKVLRRRLASNAGRGVGRCASLFTHSSLTLHSLFTHACLLYALRRLLSALSSGTLTSVDAPLMEGNEACNICGEQLEVDLGTAIYADAHVQVVLHCTHTFCTQCLIKWRKLQGKRSQVTCPMCRAPLDGTDYCAMYGLHADVGSDDPYVRRISRYGERNAARAS